MFFAQTHHKIVILRMTILWWVGDAKNERMLIGHQISFHALTDIQGELQKLQPSAVFLLLLHEIHDTTCWNIFPPSSELRLKHHFWNLVQP